ncbi:MAG: ABC transporter permease [Bacteroidales bacterium]|nr:ABC transporter permease [Bacteroidales bacterium]
MKRVFSKPDNHKVLFRNMLKEMDKLGLGSISIIMIITFFMGAVVAIQTALNLESPFVPDKIVGFTTRDSIILEFSSTVTAVILAGIIGSNISSEIGNMRISEQLDAMEIMGVNSAGSIILPKILALFIMMPFLVIIAMVVGISGGFFATLSVDSVSVQNYIEGLQWDFMPYKVFYSLIKSNVFAIIITSVSSYHGFFVKGGALEVGKASTRGVIYSIILILMANLFITYLMLT